MTRTPRRWAAAALAASLLTAGAAGTHDAQAAPGKHRPAKVAARNDRVDPLPAPPRPPSHPTQPVRREGTKPAKPGTKAATPTATARATTTTQGIAPSGTSTAAALPATARTIGTGTPRTLVLYDTSGSYAWLGESYGTAASQLATHFGAVVAEPVASYTAGQAKNYAAVVYLGSSYNEPLPAAFTHDVTTGTTPVVWAGYNIWQLTPDAASAATFTQRYGWDPSTSWIDSTDAIGSVLYKGQSLTRDSTDNQGGVLAPHITSPSQVSVLAQGVCGDATAPTTCAPIAQSSGSTLPWAVRSANLTYVGEIPFSYLDESDRYLAFADLLYAPLRPDATPVRKAAVRLEDVSPTSDPTQLKAVADYLAGAGVPFQVAVIPQYVDPLGTYNSGVAQKITLAQRPKVVAALKYMQSKGGVLVQHGSTHQYQTLANPYNAVSGDDFEFFAASCSTTAAAPFTWVPCQPDNFVQLTGPLPVDTVASHTAKITAGRKLFAAAGLATPTVFEFPHYAASPNAYKAAKALYSTRYERALYFPGALGGTASTTRWFGQFFPYGVTDVYGSKVLPENLGNYEPEAFSGHPPRLPADIVANARANLAVTESTASFFYHPYYGLDALKQTVEGIKGLGYTFVPAAQLP